ncbi:dihydrodipicolinate synthase family protein [Ligilactobacillus agilis]|uniref:Dihydrodipicolinate synthase family protein n=1 Tax=Ligilactobacillus agilis TaxID=1601 RepID=A0A848C481_9LACO|nr:dihydrodipicolinate synthase family protein [Ligilactobacillus agilis]MCI5761491.1 dihydrodipicolinate synthase family protein [Ligilactobacillus agilis]MCL8204706.1 dihydrodipicolinate synthase family protein [Ligilactobacillus agilis]MDY4064139.1 dihydrodipicolinate synthase family protein [Ligilactobacillus agilis]NME41541.1 dihydrodipicolinate synthase family protein [Ligilactobacillus agilis]
MNLTRLKGIIVPLIVPVNDDESLNESKLRQVIDHIIDDGANGILAFGSNSEFYMFSDQELETIFAVIVDEVADRIPVFFGMGVIRTSHGVKLAKMAQRMGAYGISVLQPMFLKPTDEELYLHYKTIAEAVPNLPVLIYNNPRVGYGISVNLVDKLAHTVFNIVGMKDSSGDMTYFQEIVRVTADIEFRPFTGKDTLIYLGLCAGSYGSVCSTANGLTKEVMAIYNKFEVGDLKGSYAAQQRFNPARLIQNKASFPVATKDMCNILGMDVGKPIRPSLPSKPELITEMKARMAKLK